jgi:hypothetical protein
MKTKVKKFSSLQRARQFSRERRSAGNNVGAVHEVNEDTGAVTWAVYWSAGFIRGDRAVEV